LETAAGAAILPRERVFLNWQEVKEMRESGLVSFGSHTAEHHILTTIDGEEIERQLRISKQKLTDTGAADARSISFCYPNGNYTDTIAQLVKKSGYAFAVTTQPGWNSASSASFALKRIGIHEDITTTKLMFLARVSGLFT
jgi:peptidoglycan/xylan/chitin deacetylase (PgdA/CDA1 family)